MKIISNTLLLVAILFTPVAATFAAEGPTKGTKSYQAPKAKADEAAAQGQSMRAENTQKPQDIAPAAGGMDVQPADKADKSFKEEIRLPRKN